MDKKTQSPSKEPSLDISPPSSRGGYALLFLLVGSVVAVFVWYMVGRSQGNYQKLSLVKPAVEAPALPMVAPSAHPQPTQEPIQPLVPLGLVQSLALEHVLFDQMMSRIQRGQPYQDALVLLQELLGSPSLRAELERLGLYAEKGIPSLARLTEEALRKIEAHNNASQEAENMAVRVLTSLVTVRKKSGHQNDFVEALKHHDLGVAIREGEALIQEGCPLTEVVKALQELEAFFGEVSRVEVAFETFLGERIRSLSGRTQ